MKPNLIDAIITEKEIEGIPYLHVKEAGSVLSSKVLTWLVITSLANKGNLYWEVEGGSNWIGSPEFIQAMNKPTTLHLVKEEELPANSE